jgi:hypothetical protein
MLQKNLVTFIFLKYEYILTKEWINNGFLQIKYYPNHKVKLNASELKKV